MTAGQAVYHDFIVAPTTCVPAKRLAACYIVGARLDLARLEYAARHVVARHDSLRTAIEPVDGVPSQVIRDPQDISDPVLEPVAWDGTPHDAARLVTDLDDWWMTPRPLSIKMLAGHGPADETLVVCAFNHVCSDGISAEMVFDQIRAGYDGSPVTAEQVEQFAAYYEGMLQDGLRTVFDDWVDLIDQGSPAIPDWMVRQRLATDQVWIRYLEWDLAEETRQAITDICRVHTCTPFEALAACTGIYFRRVDKRPVNIGVIHSGRDRPRGFDVTGLLRSTILELVDHNGIASIADAVRRHRDELRLRMGRFAMLPSEEVCARTGRSPGWRAGQLGLWEVELNGMYAGMDSTMQGALVRPADVPLSEEAHCENGGPTFVCSFTFGADSIRAALRYVCPPADATIADRVATDLEHTVHLVRDSPERSIDAAPSFATAVPEPHRLS